MCPHLHQRQSIGSLGYFKGAQAMDTTHWGCKNLSLGAEQMDEKSGLGSRVVSTIFIGRWTVEILSCLKKRPHHHGELLRCVEGVSQRILTRTLRNLESGGLVARRVMTARSVAVEYSLTPVGRTFMLPLTSICRWANRQHKELTANVRLLNVQRKP